MHGQKKPSYKKEEIENLIWSRRTENMHENYYYYYYYYYWSQRLRKKKRILKKKFTKNKYWKKN